MEAEKIYPKEAYWSPDSKEKECDHCGKTWPEQEHVWVEPGNYGFSGWSGGMSLCPECYMDWQSGDLS